MKPDFLRNCYNRFVTKRHEEIVKQLFLHDSENTNFKAIESNYGRFDLYLGKLLVGTLTYDNGVWKYEYSDDFKSQQEYTPLVNFPSLNQTYVLEDLFPFFASRIPSTAQLDDSKETKMDLLSLLKQYGERVITNSYTLMATH